MSNNMSMNELVKTLDEIAFEEGTSDKSKLQSIQNVLYQWEQIQDKRSERMHGSDQYPLNGHPDYPTMEEMALYNGFRRG